MKLQKILALIVVMFVCSTAVFAYTVSSEDSDIKVDKFKPSTGQQVRTSNVARAMENATYNARNKDKAKKDVSVPTYKDRAKAKKKEKKRDTSRFYWF